MINRTLEHYEITAKLGEGGMGVVYKARDPRLGRYVAIKILPPERVADPSATQRFIQEAKAASALNHPGIVTIHDIRHDGGTDFIVMEYVAGQTLDAVIHSTALPIEDVLRYAVQMADALAAAHAGGIIHRDLKPSNVMVLPERRIKILDFGLAKLLEPADASSGLATVTGPLTAAHTLLGTAAYMSPEQAEGRPVDGRSDIFSFGIMLYEMVTGARPFAGGSQVALLGRILSQEPTPPSVAVPSIPPDLEKTILRCLRKDPARRYQTMADLRVALEDLQAESMSAAARPAPGPQPRRRVAWVWVAALAVPALYIAWRVSRPLVQPEPMHAEALTTLPGAELYPALSPDGDRVAFTWTGPRQDNTDIYVQQIGAGDPLRLTTDPQSDSNPVWSPDGRWIAFLRGNPPHSLAPSARELRLVAPLGGPERKIAGIRVQETTVNAAFLTWCPDSTCLIATDTTGEGKPDGLFTIAIETGDKKPLTQPPPPAIADTNPAMSPDGTSLLFIRRETWGFGMPHVLRLGRDWTPSGDAVRVPVADLRPDHAVWLPDGKELLLAPNALAGGAHLWRIPVSGGVPVRLPYVGEEGVMPTVSNARGGESRLVYVRSFVDNDIWRIDMASPGAPSTQPAVAIASTRDEIHPQISPDGRRVAFTSTRSGTWEIWVSDLDGVNAVQLTSLRAPSGTGAPHWSPDGQLIAFASDVDGQFDVFVVAAGGGKPRKLTSDPAFDHVPTFSRDGSSIYFSSARSGQFQIWKVAVAGGTPTPVTTAGGFASQEVGDYVYFTASPAVGMAVPLWRMPTSGGPAVKVHDGVFNGAFAVTTGGIYYGATRPDVRIEFFDFVSRKATVVARNLGEGVEVGGLATSADGRTLLYVRRQSAVDDLMLVERFR